MIGSVYSGFNSGRFSFSTAKGVSCGRYKTSGANKAQKKKKLWYNFKEMSGMILRARTSGNAGQAVIMARSRLALLKKKLKTGEYDDEELKNAIFHAERMLRIAKKRQRHLKEEERAKQTGVTDQAEVWEETEEEDLRGYGEDTEGLSREQLRELMARMERLMEETEKSSEEMYESENLSKDMFVNWENLEPEELERRKKKHRADELREIIEADMKYLKALFERLEREKGSSPGSVSLELGGCETLACPLQAPVPQEGGSVDVSV